MMRRDILAMVLGATSLAAVSLMWRRPLFLTLVLLVISAGMLYTREKRRDTALFISASISGAIAEAIGIYMGAWKYTLPQAFGLPIWLPPLWGLAAVFIAAQRDFIKQLWDRNPGNKIPSP